MTTEKDGWLLSIRAQAIPDLDQVPPRHQAQARTLVDLWRRWIPPHEDDGAGDYEDFFEQADRLAAAVEHLDPSTTFLMESRDRGWARRLLDAEPTPTNMLPQLRRYGMQHRFSEFAADGQERRADQYARYDTFRKHAGRVAIPCGVNVEGLGVELGGAIQQARRAGQGRIVVKAVFESKYGLWVLDLPATVTDAQALRAVEDEVGWATVHADGNPHAFLVQGWVPMTHEYRVFVVGHVPVTGAGAIEEHTPLDSIEAFDPQLRESRQGKTAVIVDRPRRDVLVGFAKRVAAELAAEEPGLVNYTLDVALGANNEPLIVELNGLMNSGLYATTTGLTVAALMATEHRAL